MPGDFLDYPMPLAFAHRGGAGHFPENTWRAFEHAVQLGYAYLETDAHATVDGVLVAFHDKTLDRVTDRAGAIARLPASEVAAARIDGTDQIPLLEDLLGAWPQVRFNIDVKDAPAARPLADLIRRTAAWDRVCITSFSASASGPPVGTSTGRFAWPRRRSEPALSGSACPGRSWYLPSPAGGSAARSCRSRWPPHRSSAGRTPPGCTSTSGR